ncbi:MAG: iron chaperone [Flavobacteriales bacterium]
MKTFNSVDEYISSFPLDIQLRLNEIRGIIHKYAPESTEGISYGMPSYKGKKILFYFGGFKKHVSFFPTSTGITAFINELEGYNVSKGTVQFMLDREVPEELIRRLVEFRLQQDK